MLVPILRYVAPGIHNKREIENDYRHYIIIIIVSYVMQGYVPTRHFEMLIKMHYDEIQVQFLKYFYKQ